ncbi:MAG: hypothetical protein PHP07_06775 [Eubacteriales bacterium]|nr:hypothetical protein [Eubacteriales bacterium]MDD4134089.1 hypothetical protein [Eubacteriales bacterium]
MRKALSPILLWGAVWGILEATAGYALHFAAIALPGLPGALLFPLGFLCMAQAQKAAGKPSAAFWAAAIAASVKGIDLLVPGHDAIRVINPALSILLEGLAVTGISLLLPAKGKGPGLLPALGMGVLWRALFAGYLGLISLFGLPAGLVTSGPGTLLRFVLLESLINAAVIYAACRAIPRASGKPAFAIRPAAAAGAYLLALGLQAVL